MDTGPNLFKTKDIVKQIKRSLASSQGASIYTFAHMQSFYKMISDK